jgi:hypothetical protein
VPLQAAKENYALAVTFNSLGETYFRLQRHNEAIDYRSRAINLYREMMGGPHVGAVSLMRTELLTCLITLAGVHHTAGQFDLADKALSEGLMHLSDQLDETCRAPIELVAQRKALRDKLHVLRTFLATEEPGTGWYGRAHEILDEVMPFALTLGYGVGMLY